MPSPTDARGKAWLFTLNNWTEDEFATASAFLSGPTVDYGIIGKEVGESGTPHLQGYCLFRTRARFEQLEKLGGRAHIERARGSPLSNKEYCSKEGDYIEFEIYHQLRLE